MTRLIKIIAGYHGSGCHCGLIRKEVIMVIRNTYERRREESISGCGCLAV